MFFIKKLSQRYQPVEDRLQFAIENESSEIIVLWITQRISRQLLRALDDKFKFSAATIASKVNPKSTISTLPQLDLQKSQANHPLNKARLVDNEKLKEPAVIINDAKESGLVHTLNFSVKENKIEITFRWGITGAALVLLDQDQLKVFWKGLLKLFAVAKWPQIAINKEPKETRKNTAATDEDVEDAFEAILTSKLMH
ncbi:hypothetical protein [Candidatus Methylopumilus turicensis]|uniref:Uncharacterized protein n=1 Tax=Candidatus Methylopumilus turicensis TaxID=1581680 RepID=A0A0B7IVA2_9PROT|nr:hypothetical protein [Candidatus Methylopumilus turicensis]CEN56216.1 protein of unknown function [Candidatus Methylopumilus turicensis]